ncbi:MAG: endonuclease/exonuclease/phosphatase family protein [Anaerolineae bacterium]|nr:endonuclease/exonuclease/phosphatase family protein [Anaerolineae bacterium]
MPLFRRDLLRFLEAGTVGLFLIQGVRFLYATLYAHASSADLVDRVPNPDALIDVPGVVEVATVQHDLLALGLLALPLLAIVISRWRISLSITVILVALGRSMALQTPDLEVPATALVVGAGLLYLALVIIRRHTFFPIMLLVGLTAEQVIRALDNTVDHTWQSDYTLRFADRVDVEMGLLIAVVSVLLILLTLLLWFVERQTARLETQQAAEQEAAAAANTYRPHRDSRRTRPGSERGVLSLWGGLALGGILFLELTLLSLPNVVAHWSGVDYTGLVPWLLAATALPLVPEVREIARRFAGMFDGAWRGWLWMLLLGLLLVVGQRYEGIPAGIALVLVQFLAGLTLWWLVQVGTPRRNPTGLMVLAGVFSFGVLALGDYFTYDYAYVRDLSEPYQNVSDVLRSFRDMGLGLALIAALLACIPMILSRRRIPWRGGKTVHTLLALVLVLGVSFAGAVIAGDATVRRPLNPDCLRAATYNIHGGYSQFFNSNLEDVAQIIELNGADIVLLQEIETGRLASFGVDQVMWLARRLDMESAFFPQNEKLQGLAVLSRIPIVDTEALLLPSDGNQAAVMHVTLDVDTLANDPDNATLGDLHVYNAWLGFRVSERDGQPVTEGDQDQNRQHDAMLNWIAARNVPDWNNRLLIGGTFNYIPDSPLYQRLRMNELDNPGIKDPFAGLRAETANTVYLVDGTAARYDYLWVYQLPFSGVLIDISPEAANASDHRPAIVAISRREGITCEP